MSLFKQNTEETFLCKMRDLRQSRDGWCMTLMKGDVLDVPKRRALRTKESHEKFKHLMRVDGIIPYFCADWDILFLYKNLRKHSETLLKGFVCDLFPNYQKDDVVLNSFFDHYVLKDSYRDVVRIVQLKESVRQEKQKSVVAKALPGLYMPGEYVWSNQDFHIAREERLERESPVFLVIEDDELLRDLAKTTLLSQRLEVVTAADGKSALHTYNHFAPDVTFLDINLPDKNGIDILETLKGYDPEGNIVMFSSEKNREIVTKALGMGACGYVVKPFTSQTLYKYARKFL